MSEQSVVQLTAELQDIEESSRRSAAKAERDKLSKQLDEQEREMMRLKALLHGEKSEFYRLMEQEKAK